MDPYSRRERSLTRWIPVMLYSAFVYLCEIVLAWVECRYSLTEPGKALKVLADTFPLVAWLFFLGLIVRMARKRLFRNMSILVIVGCMLPYLWATMPFVVEKVHLALYFPLGMLLYRIYRNEPISIRLCLHAFIVAFTISFIDRVVQGVIPNREYTLVAEETIPFILVTMLGMLFSRTHDSDRPLVWPRGIRSQRQYSGPRPLLDLHFYARDTLYVAYGFLVVVAHTFITSQVSNEDLVGRWKSSKDPHEIVVLRKDGGVCCNVQGKLRRIGTFTTTGSIFDGFSIKVFLDPERNNGACAFLEHHISTKRTIRLVADTIEFTQTKGECRPLDVATFWHLKDRTRPLHGQEGVTEVWEKLN